jgi:hypothetical protein
VIETVLRQSFRLDGREVQSSAVLDLASRALRCALQEEKDARATEREVREVLRVLCDTARARGMYAEQVIVLLKETWRDLPEVRRPAPEHEMNALSRVVTLCIDEYYAYHQEG